MDKAMKSTTVSQYSSSSSSNTSQEEAVAPEVVEEPDQEVDKPAVSEEDMLLLVEKVKTFTTLFDLRDEDWTPRVVSKIQLFFERPTEQVLTIFFDEAQLRAALGFPCVPVHDLMFFVKDPGIYVTPEKFPDMVMFGTTNHGVTGAMLNLLENGYGAIFFECEWSESVRNDMRTFLHSFLANQTDLHYKLLGFSLIYVPREGFNMNPEEASLDKDLTKRLEGIVIHWVRQMRLALCDLDMTSLDSRLTPLDEYQFWIDRLENLTGLRLQMENEFYQHIYRILTVTNSSYLHHCDRLAVEIDKAMDQSREMIKLLTVLEEPCMALAAEKVVSRFVWHVAPIIHTFRFIWEESNHYHNNYRMTRLCRCLSNQIIVQCTRSINFKAIFGGQSRLGKETFRACIDCCLKYQTLYEKIVAAHANVEEEGEWDVETESIFAHLESFIQRCTDLIYVCETMMVFARMDEEVFIPKPHFSGSRAGEFEAMLDNIEKIYRNALRHIRLFQRSIFNVHTCTWFNVIRGFRATVMDLDVLAENLICDVFDEVTNVQEGIAALQAVLHFSTRANLNWLFEKKTNGIYLQFVDDMYINKKSLDKVNGHSPSYLPTYAGISMVIRMKKARIVNTMNAVNEAQWLNRTGKYDEMIVAYHKVCEALDKSVDRYYSLWRESLGEEKYKLRLDRPLMRHSLLRPGLLEANFDRRLLVLCREARYWELMKYEVPFLVMEVYQSWKELRFLYESVLTVVMDYNRIIAALSDAERSLFKELIRKCEKKISPGIYKLKWNTEVSDIYISDCCKHTSELQDFLDDFKNSNVAIVNICRKICDTPMINHELDGPMKLALLEDTMDRFRRKVMIQFIERYQEIIQFLLIIYEGFESHILNMEEHWTIYILRMDKVLEESIRLSVRSSLNILLGLLRGDETSEPRTLLHMSANLKDNNISFEPTLQDVAEWVTSVLSNMVNSVRVLPRIVEKFKLKAEGVKPYWKVVEECPECTKLQTALNFEMASCVSLMQNFLKIWDPFRDMWEVSKDLFVVRYERLKPDVATFDSDISRYSEVANLVGMKDSITNVQFILVNSSLLKRSIIDHCNQWQNKLSALLAKITRNRILDAYEYMDKNGKLIMQEPTTLAEMAEAINLHEQLLLEVPDQEAEFPIMRDQFTVLGKYNVSLNEDVVEKLNNIDDSWKKYLALLQKANDMLSLNKDKFRNNLLDTAEKFKKEATMVLEDFLANGPFSSDWEAKDAIRHLQGLRERVEEMRRRELQLQADLAIFGISLPFSHELEKLEKDLATLLIVWELTDEWNMAWESYKSGEFWTIETEEMEETAQSLFRKLTRLSRELADRNWEIVEHTRARVDAFRRTLPLLGDLKNTAMRARHWEQVKAIMGINFDQNSPDFTLDAIMEMNFQKYAEQINEISNAATMELAIEHGLKVIADIWAQVKVEMAPFKDRGIFRLKTVDEIFQTLEENQMSLSGMKSTRFVEPFMAEVDYWERALSVIMEVLELFLVVQRQWVYLENIFSGEDIRKQMPDETDQFDRITNEWQEITSKMNQDPNALRATHQPNLWKRLNKLNVNLEIIQRALEKYLETKRYIFPRFYFISNDDLLEILAQSKKPEMVMPHLKKLFDNINKVRVVKIVIGYRTEAASMISADGEMIDFARPVVMEGPVEMWLCDIETEMRNTLHGLLKSTRMALKKLLSKRDKWIKDWPGQMCITSSQMQWTTDCTRSLAHCKLMESKKPMKKIRKKMNQILAKFSEAIRGTLTKVQRLKVVSLVTIEIHARDVIDKMYKMGCMGHYSFEWLSQLRFYWDRDLDDCLVKQTNTCFKYNYEYLGNSGRLVITPLTDRCYITLTTALHLHRGGSPKGPAGTGKTETVKDLGKGLGMYVIVVNCSEGLDYKSMGRMFSGLAQTGAWGCFDEFNRINIEVLSVVAQQILSILSALAAGLKRFSFEGTEINLVSTCGIFITMNPGYAGRTELPDNLKSMFRPISMIVPDSAMIAEITLFGEGFKDTRMLAKKVYTLFQLAMQQLSKQDHYDFGLRGMVALLRYAGRKRRSFPKLPDEEVVLLAMKDMNVAKLTADDLPLFNGITSDLFPGVEVPTIDYKELAQAVTLQFHQSGLQAIANSVTKVIQLYETKNSRHSVMIVGKTGSGKTATWKTLRDALSHLRKENKPGYNFVKEYPINPKALSLGELYGEFNLSTNEWLDGVLSAIMRKTCADELPDEKWILFDGPVDAVWIENMNSVMDDNKILTLINSERITMPEQVSLLFEVEDLAVASPATVSRCGMVYNDYKDLGWKPYVSSWLHRLKPKELVDEVRNNFNRFLQRVLQYKRHNCNETVPVSELNSVMSLCKLLECLALEEAGLLDQSDPDAFQTIIKMWFLFCLVWSVCASVDEDGRRKLDVYIREMDGVFPLKNTIYEYFIDTKTRSFNLWEEMLSDNWKYDKASPFFKIIVPTVDTVRYQYLVSMLLRHGYPSLLMGPVGTGKTSTAMTVLESLDLLKYCLLIINMSAQTSSNNVQDIIESRVEKRTKGVFVPPGSKTMVTFMDDLNMPAKETYGSQPPLELIRQWIDYGFWYDRQKQETKHVKEMLLMAAMGPPGGGRNVITNRLLSRFNVINMTFPSDTQIIRIFGTMLDQQLQDFEEELRVLAPSITEATLDLYTNVVAKMLPTPAKMHYLFNLRDISKIFQGMLRCSKDTQSNKAALLRLWIHECFRVFSDKLIDEKDLEWFVDQINQQLGRYFDLTFHSLCPDRESPIFGDFVNPWGIYEDLPDFPVLRKYIEGQLEEYNVSPGIVRMDLVLFKDAICHICRIVRVISQPRGNMLLVGIGGSGRQSMARIAAYICEYHIFQIEVTKNYRVQEFREDLKALYKMSGIDNKATCFLFNDTQVADECFLEIINNVLSSGEVPNLYKAEEFEEIKNTLTTAATKAKIQLNSEAIFNFLIDRVRSNLHIVLCMSPIGDAFRNRLRQYPSLINCTTIDWFHDWPKEALLEVANKYLADVDFLETIFPYSERDKPREYDILMAQERLRAAVAGIFATIHDSVSKCSRRMMLEIKRPNYVTPTNYLELVAGYKTMLTDKRVSTKAACMKLSNGLFKIDDTREKVEIMSVELEEAKLQVAEYQQQCDEYLVIIVVQKREADEQQILVTARSHRIAEEELICQKLADVAQADLNEAMPALEEAMRALDALNKKDLTEIRSYGRPPAKVEMVMEAVMILKQVEPSWAEAKRQLGDQNFLNNLREFDKDNISERTMKKIAVYTNNEEFEPDKVGVVSFAAKSLCMWVRAIEKYGQIWRIVAPKKAKLEEATSTLRAKQQALADAQAKLVELSVTLEKLKKEYEDKLEQKEALRLKAEILMAKLERAAMLVDGLSGEKIRWEQSVQRLDLEFGYLPGDCLIATGFVSYLGPFVTQYRDELVALWRKSVAVEDVPINHFFQIITFLSDPTTIREWNIQGLPSDEFSTENGIIVTRAMRWPLLIDPQTQGMKWIKKMEGEKDLKVIDSGQPDFMKTMESAVQFGHSVLLQNVMEVLDPSLGPILNKAVVKQGGQMLIKINDKMISYNQAFRFFITTKLGNPHYAPEISTKTTLVNFAVKEQGLEAQLLGIVVRKERPQLEEQKDSLVINIATGKRTLIDLEDELLRLLNETKGSLLDDMQLLMTLQSSKATSISVAEQLRTSEVTEVEIDAAREGYRPCAQRASILFFVLNDMSRIDPMYQFSLDAYLLLFTISIDKSRKSDWLDDRINFLNDYHTYSVYRNTCRGLFERHKLLFSFHMCIKTLEAQGKVMPAEYNFLLKGGVVLDREEQRENPCVTWLIDVSWDNITELDKIGGFHGVINTFEQNPNEWHIWYTSKEPENEALIGEWDSICNEFQRMLFIRSLRPDRISFCVTTFICNTLGPKYVEPPVLDIKATYEDSTSHTPLIFVLSPGVDPTNALIQLAETLGMGKAFQSLSLGQGQAPIATKMIRAGAKDGHWVFLANCHLSLSWMPKLDKIVEKLENTKIHNKFRLWLSSSPHPDFPISILQAGIKMTTEPPRGLRANLKRLYHIVTEQQFTTCKTQAKYKKLLFSLCFFHSVLLERKKFQQLGWNVIYSFNDSDFEVSENLLAIYLDEYTDTPWDALKYLIAGVNYGGHVTDDWDRRLLTTYINQFFTEDAVSTNFYRLSSLQTYYIPRDGSLQSYRDYIGLLPTIDQPEVFGQHSNADITSLITETRSLFETLMSLQVQVSTSVGISKEDKVLQLSSDILTRIPQPIDYENTDKLIGNDKTPLQVVLLQEITRYNFLLVTIRTSVEELQRGIQGFVVMSSELEDIFVCIFEGRVPQKWLKAYPSLKLLGSWTRDLVLRVEHFSRWAETTHAPMFFWLAAYTFPTGFLTAVLQTTARRTKTSIDSLSWEFIPFVHDEHVLLERPKSGVFVRGLFLEGAGWDLETQSLVEPQPMQLVCAMPLIHFKPVENLKKKTKGMYVCPSYYYPLRCGATGRAAFVVAVDLRTKIESADHWIKRGTALLLSLAN